MAPLEVGLHFGEELEGAGEGIARDLQSMQIERIHVSDHHACHTITPNDTVHCDLTFYIRRLAAEHSLRLVVE